jgi:hypothetical protein
MRILDELYEISCGMSDEDYLAPSPDSTGITEPPISGVFRRRSTHSARRQTSFALLACLSLISLYVILHSLVYGTGTLFRIDHTWCGQTSLV